MNQKFGSNVVCVNNGSMLSARNLHAYPNQRILEVNLSQMSIIITQSSLYK